MSDGRPGTEPDGAEQYPREHPQAERWCRFIVNSCYLAIGVNAVILIAVWLIFVLPVYDIPHGSYWARYIVAPTAVMLAVNGIGDAMIRSARFSTLAKEYLAMLMLLFFCTFLCFFHSILAALLVTFVVPVFLSTLFADVKLTRRVFLLCQIALVLSGVKMRYLSTRDFDMWIWVETVTASGILSASYLLSKVLIKYGQHHMTTLADSYKRQSRLREQLMRDPLTGLYNRKAYDEYIPVFMQLCREAGSCLSMAMLDLDNFKRVNDTYGHAVGDKVLQRLAHILLSNRTEEIFAFRIGGEEFVLLLKDYCLDDAYKVCEGMRSIMESASVPEAQGLRVTFSCGIAQMEEYDDALSLFKAADSALYRAKDNGRNRIELFDGASVCVSTQKDLC